MRLTVFVDHPQVPMDNSEAERQLRGPAMGRKNYWGSGAVWAGELAERCQRRTTPTSARVDRRVTGL